MESQKYTKNVLQQLQCSSQSTIHKSRDPQDLWGDLTLPWPRTYSSHPADLPPAWQMWLWLLLQLSSSFTHPPKYILMAPEGTPSLHFLCRLDNNVVKWWDVSSSWFCSPIYLTTFSVVMTSNPSHLPISGVYVCGGIVSALAAPSLLSQLPVCKRRTAVEGLQLVTMSKHVDLSCLTSSSPAHSR